ncbi:energy transducer TonB [Kordiimonas pumila]|uniref:Energy transducer TonB n=1 Tax=Kordiimonas pumila TaxID=2161677 RepID=A0ABV7D5V7_9PROT|nr:TonB family protein [Kordiimonas pumila]
MRTILLNGRKTRLLAILGGGMLSAMVFLSAQASADDLGDWRKNVVKSIIQNHIYPRSAISREIEGKAKVKVSIDRSGAILNFEIVEESGESVLDGAIPKMMEKLNPLPAPPAALDDDNLTFVIPITWRLQ